MNKPLAIQTRIQQLMLGSGMLYALVQLSVLLFVVLFILPELGPVDAPLSHRVAAYANHPHLLRAGNYLMVLPPIFFLLFLGGIYAYFTSLPEQIKGILMAVLLSGAILIMLWPQGAVISLLGVDIANQGGDPVTAALLDGIPPHSLALSTIPRFVFLFCFSVLLLEHKWLSRTGFLIAVLSLIGSLLIVFGPSFLPFSLGSVVLFQVWIFTCSYRMFRNHQRITNGLQPGSREGQPEESENNSTFYGNGVSR